MHNKACNRENEMIFFNLYLKEFCAYFIFRINKLINLLYFFNIYIKLSYKLI